MSTLICFGLGYSAEHFVAAFGDGFDRIVGTVRTAERATVLNAHLAGRLKALIFDVAVAPPELSTAIADAEFVLCSVPPDEAGDPVLAAFGDAFSHARRLRSIVYLSTVGVYGDHGGEWVDEETPAKPESPRSRVRLAAERAWQELGAHRGIAVAILRLAGIYGPGQNALTQIARGTARRIVKPGQVFNRIHVDDIAQAIDAAFAAAASGIFNIADDEPTPAGEPLAFAARLLGVEPPPEIPFDQATSSMSPMALSFWQECRRVRNQKLKRDLGVVLRYPTYREGLRFLSEAR
jgi:nucleoside-diphosphate-sugar epimerase